MNHKQGFLFLLFITIIFLKCSIKEPVLPRWSAPFMIPLASERLVFQKDLVNDTTIIDKGDLLAIQIREEFGRRSLTIDDLSIEGEDTTSEVPLDSLLIDSLTMSSSGLSLRQLLPQLGSQTGQTVTIPQSTISEQIEKVRSSDFKAIKITRGRIDIFFQNNLPLTLGSATGIEFSVYDSLGTFVTSLAIPDTLQPGESGFASAPLSQSTDLIYSPFRVDFTIPIARDTLLFITDQLLDTSNFQIQATLSDLEVEEIIGKLPMQSFKETITVALDQENKLIRAEVAEGSLDILYSNRISASVRIRVTLPDLLTVSGQPYQDEILFLPNESIHRHIILDGFTLHNSASPGEVLDSIDFQIRANTLSSQEFVHVKRNEVVEVGIQSSPLKFQALQGFLAKDTLEISPFEQSDVVDYEGFNRGLQFDQAYLLLELENDIEIDSLLFNLDISAYHKDQNSGLITDSAKIVIRNEFIGSGQDTLRLEGADIVDVLNILPTDFKGSGFVAYSGFANVSVGDMMKGYYQFTTDLKFKISNPEPYQMKPDTLFDEDIEDDVQDAIAEEKIGSSRLTANLINHTPLGGSVRLLVNGDDLQTDLYDTTQYANSKLKFIKRLDLIPAPVNSQGWVTQPSENTVVLELSRSEMELFQHPPLRVGILVNFAETDGFVVLRGSDYIDISGNVEVQVLFKDED
ncbi:MAG: hypothetical protein Kow0042_10030 [Calditrichia bacterium]